MKYRLQDLIDMEHFQNLQDRLNEIYSFPSSIIDNEGNILTATAWQDICTQFHRKNKDTELLCIKSDQYIQSHIHEANPAVSYRCPHGLVDNATPIIIDGIHYGNFFTGQFFLEEPDMNYFKVQANKYGFDEDAYLESVKKVPIWTQDQLDSYLFFIKGLIAVISESGLKKLKEIETREHIEKSEKRHRSILKTAMDGYWLTDTEGRLLEINDAYCEMSGYSQGELLTMHISDLEASESPQLVAKHMHILLSKGADRFESKHRRKDGTVFDVEVSVQFRPEEDGQCVCFLRDITERKKNEEALKESELFLENMSDIAYRADNQGNIVWVNSAGERVTGLSRDDLIGKPFLPLFIEADQQSLIDVYKRTLLGESQENTLTFKSGVSCHFTSLPHRSKNGDIDGAFGVARDITAQLDTQRALQISEARLKKAQATAKIGNWEYDITTGKVWGSEEAFRIYGIERTSEFLPLDEVESRILDARRVNLALVDLIYRKKIYDIEFQINTRAREGLTLIHSMADLVCDAEGNPVKVQGVIQDITELKRAEESLKESEVKYRSMMEAMDDAVYICSGGFHIEYMNTAMIRRIGYDATGELCHKAMHGLDEKCPWCIHDKVMEGQFIKTEVVSPKDNRTYHVSNSPILHSHGAVSKLTILRDITETKKTEERLLQAQKMEAIGSLAGGIAHDLNNILFPISGLSEMLLDEMQPDDPSHESLEQIHKSAIRGSELVKQILTFSRQSKPQKLPIRIQPIIKEVLKLVRATIPTNIEITSHISLDCGMVFADPTQVHQIIMNLVTNAYHAVEQTIGTINLELKETEFEKDDSMKFGKYASISISDTGTGIDQMLIDKIFDPYFTTKEQGKGTGLGLSVVHGIVKEHGGDIRVYSELGKGTSFHVYLPLLEDARASKTASVTRKYPTGTESILLVDDEEPIARMLQMMLERLGYQVTVRTSSLDALDAFRANLSKFDLVISDRGMPNLTGEQLALELISIRPGIPIILCTGFSDENDENRARTMGVKGILKKPVATGDLAEMVRMVMDEVACKDQP